MINKLIIFILHREGYFSAYRDYPDNTNSLLRIPRTYSVSSYRTINSFYPAMSRLNTRHGTCVKPILFNHLLSHSLCLVLFNVNQKLLSNFIHSGQRFLNQHKWISIEHSLPSLEGVDPLVIIHYLRVQIPIPSRALIIVP